MSENENDEDKELEELEKAFLEMELLEEEGRKIFSEFDTLCSIHDFLGFKMMNLKRLSSRFEFLKQEVHAIFKAESEHQNLHLGIFWMGAISVYEGAMHEFFIKSLTIEKLQHRVDRYCREEGLKEYRRTLRFKGTDAEVRSQITPENVKRWLAATAISDPAASARRFEQIYKIQTPKPDKAWCDQILEIRNQVAHRNGVDIDHRKLLDMLTKLEEHAANFHRSFLNDIDGIADGSDDSGLSP